MVIGLLPSARSRPMAPSGLSRGRGAGGAGVARWASPSSMSICVDIGDHVSEARNKATLDLRQNRTHMCARLLTSACGRADLAPLEPGAGSSYPRLPFEDLRKLMSTAPQSAAPHSVMRLADRSVIAIDGEDAANFLAGVVTCAVDEAGPARFGALLTPQGKII